LSEASPVVPTGLPNGERCGFAWASLAPPVLAAFAGTSREGPLAGVVTLVASQLLGDLRGSDRGPGALEIGTGARFRLGRASPNFGHLL
jgi:hypothetical protein